MSPVGLNPDGKINLASLADQQKFYIASGSQTKAVDLNKLVDPTFAQNAVKLLGGPYK